MPTEVNMCHTEIAHYVARRLRIPNRQGLTRHSMKGEITRTSEGMDQRYKGEMAQRISLSFLLQIYPPCYQVALLVAELFAKPSQ